MQQEDRKSAKAQVIYRGIGFGSLLTLIFVAAKLWDRVDWSWIWVFSPLWIEAAVVLAVCVGVLVFAGVVLVVCGVADGVKGVRRRSLAKNGQWR